MPDLLNVCFVLKIRSEYKDIEITLSDDKEKNGCSEGSAPCLLKVPDHCWYRPRASSIAKESEIMVKGKNVLTTGDVARICNVAPRTVSSWFDKGLLSGYRIPGSSHRRIPVEELIRFMEEHSIPTTTASAKQKRSLKALKRS